MRTLRGALAAPTQIRLGRASYLKFRALTTALALAAALGQSLAVLPARAAAATPGGTLLQAVAHDVSAPLRSLHASPVPPAGMGNHSHRPLHPNRSGPSLPTASGSIQTSAIGAAIPSTSTNFEGVSNADNLAVLNPPLQPVPPDTNGDVGPHHYVQWVNLAYEIFDRLGNKILGPSPGNTPWSGFADPVCANTNQGDPVVRYDHMADRWIFTQFAFNTDRRGNPVAPFEQCFAVSTTGDPAGPYNRYSWNTGNAGFPDYPKLGVWPDGYYMSVNIFSGNTFVGGGALVFDRIHMISGQAATAQGFGPLGAAYGGLLPSDLDGSILPPAGSPNYFGAIDTNVAPSGNTLQLWKFHVDWANSANSTFGTATNTPNFNLAVATYRWLLCNGSRNCIPQPGTNVGLDAIPDRLMNRLQYRRFADGHESLVANHTVGVGSSGNQAAIRWYEIRNLSSTPTIYQQGTYAATSDNRWMGSMAMDQAGDIALGYSVSSSTVYPSIRYTGRLASDTLGTLPQGEATIVNGSGSQTTNFSRWGDYSMMAVDPTDDCTFWYTQEYYFATSDRGWQTRIGSFKFPSCGVTAAPTSLAANPVSTTQINLAWTGSTGATSYKVERSPDGTSSWAQVGTSTITTFSDTGLASGRTYFYRVRASNSSGDSGPSNVASATTYLGYSQSPQGNWLGNYGADGYGLLAWNGSGDLVSLPQSNLVLDQGGRWQWTASTTDVRALESPDGTTRRATTVYDANQLRLHLSFNAAYTGTLHLYAVDWDAYNRRESISINDGSGPRTANITTSFTQGAWVSVPISVASGGTVTITVNLTGGLNAVLSGVFLGGAGPSLAYSQSPQGTWLGNYGAGGYGLLAWNGSGDLVSLPQSSLVLDQGGRWQWTASTTDVRALESPDGTTRRATTVYDANQLRLHLSFNAAYTGTLHLYAVDWDAYNRRESISINDGSGPRTANITTSFTQGAWVSVPISVASGGTVTITVNLTGGLNAVLSGVFLG